MQFVKPQPFTEAVDKLGSRSVIGSQLDSEAWSRVPLALRERAFFSSQVESARFLQRARDSVADALQSSRETLENGQTVLKTGSRADFVKQLQDFAVAEGLGTLEPGEEEGAVKAPDTLKNIASERRLALIFDTQTRQAQDYGYWKQGMDADVLNAFPASRFIRVRPVKEPRDMHQHHEGEVHLKSDLPFWIGLNQDFGVPWGPWGWGCGHDVEDVDRATAEQLGLIARGEKAVSPEVPFNEHLQASVQHLDPDLQDSLRSAFGDQVTIEGDTARWAAEPSAPPAPAALPGPLPAPVLPPVARDVSPARISPVSQAVQLLLKPIVKSKVETALGAIDKVHDDGKLNPIPVMHKVPGRAQGVYSPGARYIGIRESGGLHPELTFAHETGHWLDEKALPGSGFSSSGSPELEEWRTAVFNSQAYKNLVRKPEYIRNRKYQKYQVKFQELWARSYAQFIATRSENSVMLEQLERIRAAKTGSYWPDSQWSDEDFAPIGAAIESLFKKMGWL